MKNLFENWREYLEEDLEDFDRDTLQSKSELTPEIWQDFRLKPEIRERLLAIAENFFNGLKLGEVSVRDIVLTGSLANYNWSKYSDIDLHIIINLRCIQIFSFEVFIIVSMHVARQRDLKSHR